MCCGTCGVWQHIACHDAVDKRAGRPPRNWDSVEFTCRKCSPLVQARDNEDSKSSVAYDSRSRREKGVYPTLQVIPTSDVHPSIKRTHFRVVLSFITLFICPLTVNYSGQQHSTQLLKATSVMPSASHDANSQASRFAYYQPTERSYAHHPASIQNLINPQPEIQHKRSPGHWKVNNPDPSQQSNIAPPYVPFAYPKVASAYVSAYPANPQQQSYLSQPQATPHLTNQSYYHPQV